MKQFIFCHGFGFDQSFWQNLAPFFPKEKCSYLDLGYFNQPKLKIKREEEQLIGIGHSLGLIKLLARPEKFSHLIGLNSFTDFLGNDPILHRKRRTELALLKKQLVLSPQHTLKNFYARCGTPTFANQLTAKKIDLTRLQSDLELLSSADIQSKQTSPLLIIGALDDPIVPLQLIADNFANRANTTIEMVTTGKHGLGFLVATTIYKKINNFIK